jgi:hypothetical protein
LSILTKKIAADIWFSEFSSFSQHEIPESNWLVIGRNQFNQSDEAKEIGFISIAGTVGYVGFTVPTFELRFQTVANVHSELFPSATAKSWYAGSLLSVLLSKLPAAAGRNWYGTTDYELRASAIELRTLFETYVHPVFRELKTLDDVCNWFETDPSLALHWGSELMFAISFYCAQRPARAREIASICLERNERDSRHISGAINLQIRDAFQNACRKLILKTEE